MVIQQPLGTDPLNVPSHSLSHRVFANDEAAPVESVVVDANGKVTAQGLPVFSSQVSATDTTPAYLNSKITVSGGLVKTTTNPSGNEIINIGNTNHSIQLSGDLRGWYQSNVNVILIDLGSLVLNYPNGIVITNWKVYCNTAPTTQLAATISYCDGVSSASFPGASPIVVDTIATTAGYQTRTNMATSTKGDGIVPTGKILYLAMTANPTDYLKKWTLIINFTIS